MTSKPSPAFHAEAMINRRKFLLCTSAMLAASPLSVLSQSVRVPISDMQPLRHV
jgi:hypothetical protein